MIFSLLNLVVSMTWELGNIWEFPSAKEWSRQPSVCHSKP